MVRLDTGVGLPTTLAAVQQGGWGGNWLGFFRSNDEGASWNYYLPIQNDGSLKDTADLITVGNDIAMVYSYEGPEFTEALLHGVTFQWWTFDGLGNWASKAAVPVFSPLFKYYRAQLVRDSRGYIWVHAFRFESLSRSVSVVAVSTTNGASFQEYDLDPIEAPLARGGGRISSLGGQLILLWDRHDSSGPARMRIRNDADIVTQWGPAQEAFLEGDGIYHGAALSAVADGIGGLHLFYRGYGGTPFIDELSYRYFNGKSFGPRQTLALSTEIDWATQAATTLVGSVVYVFYNSFVRATPPQYRLLYRQLQGGLFTNPVELYFQNGFMGYPTAIEALPKTFAMIPCAVNLTPDANSPGFLQLFYSR
jgi:hypothetical protein